MKRFLALMIVYGLWAALPVYAQLPEPTITASLTTSTCPDNTNTGCVTLNVRGYSGVAVQLSGTWSGTVTFESCVGFGCSTYQPLAMKPSNSTTAASTASGNGLWLGAAGGAEFVRVRFSTATSGTVVVSLTAAPSANAVNTGGGGGGSGNVTGPGSSTANAPALFADASGTVLINSTPTGSGNPVLQTGPTLTTPNIGVASGTSATLSSLTANRLVFADTAGLLTTPSTLFYNPTSAIGGAGGTSPSRPVMEFDMGFAVKQTRTSPTMAYPISVVVGTLSPSSDQAAGAAGALFKTAGVVLATAGKFSTLFGGDFYTITDPTNTQDGIAAPNSAIGGSSNWAESQSATYVYAILGSFHAARMLNAGGTADYVVPIVVDPGNGADPTLKAGTAGNFYGVWIKGMDLQNMVVTNTRAGIYISPMAGAPTTPTLDFALYNAASQPIYSVGAISTASTFSGIGASFTGTGSGAYTSSSTTVFTADISGRSTRTTKAANNTYTGLIYETISNATTIAAGAYTVGGIVGLVTVPNTDTAVYPALSSLAAGGFTSTYGGGTGGSIDSVFGLTASAIRGASAGTGGVVNTIMAGVKSSILQLENTGTVPITAAFYAARPLSTASSTITLQAGVYLERQDPASGTTTASYGFYQAGTEGNFFGGKFTTYNNVTTAGMGVPVIVAATRVAAQSAANSSIATYPVGASDGDFEVSMNMNVTAAVALATTMTCTYTDESGTSRSMIFPVTQLAGSFIAAGAVTGTGAWETPVLHIRAKAATAITLLTSTGTFTTVTYTASGIIRQIA